MSMTILSPRELRSLLSLLDQAADAGVWTDSALTIKLEQMYAERASQRTPKGAEA